MNEPQPEPEALQDKLGPPAKPDVSKLETLIRRIAPADIASRPVYVCLASEMPSELKPSHYTYGFHSTFLDIAFRSWLSDCGRWRGRGPAIVINDDAIGKDANESASTDVVLRDDIFRTRILAITLHETAHVLTSPIDLRPIPSDIAAEIEKSTRDTVIQWIENKPLPPDSEMTPQWAGHELEFIRVLLHVINRAESLGIERLPDVFLFSNANYSLSGLWAYRRALKDELEGFDSSLTFFDLRKCHPPKSFIELWRNDLHAWWKWMAHDEGPIQIAAAMAPYTHVFEAD
jgi:hypothetical protein